ncbi:hypothetical protein SHIRM173S_04204 [Streptomyces hirsutus]
MGKIRGRLLPGLFAVTQLVLWCFTVPTLEKPPGVTEWIVALSATAFTTVALARRTRAPLHALGGILVVSVLVQLLTPPDTVALVSGLAVLMTLFSVTTLSDWTVSLGATAVTAVVQLLPIAMKSGFGGTFLHEWLTAVSMYLMVSALGAGRRHWLRERQMTKQRLTRAEQERGQAAGTERDRLANELHDISAHHLTSVVVSVEAARRLGDTRPELAAEALTFASRTAYETQSALRRLVAVMRVDDVPAPQSVTPAIEALIAGFGRLGRPISVSLPADLVGPAAEAVHGIIREALTNALRYAPGASISIRAERSEDALDLTIDNGKPPSGTGSHRLSIGSGRGVDGMRRRATAVGGQLSAGPRPDGGWRVHAVLPDARSARQPATGRRRNVHARAADRGCGGLRLDHLDVVELRPEHRGGPRPRSRALPVARAAVDRSRAAAAVAPPGPLAGPRRGRGHHLRRDGAPGERCAAGVRRGLPRGRRARRSGRRLRRGGVRPCSDTCNRACRPVRPALGPARDASARQPAVVSCRLPP